MDNKILQWYEYLIEVYGISKATVILAEKLLDDYDDKSNMKELEIILINALFHSASVNISRILDHDENGVNIHKFLATYSTDKKSRLTFMVDLAAVERLRKRRNKLLVHADKVVLSQEAYEKFPLYIEDLKSILKSLENLLFPLSKEIIGACIAGKNLNTGEWDFSIARQVETQYGIYKNMLSQYRQMKIYMRENCPDELFRIYYTKEEADDGQT